MGGRGSYSTSSAPDTSYWLQHRPGNPLEDPEGVATADRITSGEFFPEDMLNHPDWYFSMEDDGAWETVRILKRLQGNPDAVVTVYRGAPSGELNTGDWVTLSKSYASIYAGDGAYSDNPNSKVYSFQAKASELSFDGDDISEFGYWGKRKTA